MNTGFYFGFCLFAGLMAFAGDLTGDSQALQGKWKPVTAVLGGKPMPAAVVNTISLKLEQGRYEVFVGKEPDRGTYTIDTATQPRAMTISGVDGPNKGKTFPAIYELNGETLRICYDLAGANRPTEFKTVPGTKLYLVTYRRAE